MKMNISIIMKMNMDQKPNTSISPQATRKDGKGAARRYAILEASDI